MHLSIHYYLVILLLLCCNTLPAQQQTVLFEKQRVKNIRYFNSDTASVPLHDIWYHYSGTRGSEYKSYEFYNGGVHGFRTNYIYTGSVIPAFDMPEPIADLQTRFVHQDSCIAYSNLGGNTYATITTNTHQTKLLTGTTVRTGKGLHYNAITYNEQGLPAVICLLHTPDTTFAADTICRRVIYYDADKRPIADTIYQKGSDDHYIHYTYNEHGRLQYFDVTPYKHNDIKRTGRTAYSYDAQGNVVLVLHQQLDKPRGFLWINLSKQNYTYDQANRLLSASEGNGEGIPRYHKEYFYNYEGDADTQTVLYIDEDVVTECEKTVFYFNRFHNPDSAITYYNYCRNVVRRQRTLYTYETYYADSLGDKSPMTIFPNPTTGLLYIRWGTRLPQTGAYINVFSSAGQLVKRVHTPTAKPIDEVDMRGLPKGVYYLYIMNGEEAKIYKGGVTVY